MQTSTPSPRTLALQGLAPLSLALLLLAQSVLPAQPWRSPIDPAVWTTGIVAAGYFFVRLVAAGMSRPLSDRTDLRLQGVGLGAGLAVSVVCGGAAAWRALWMPAALCAVMVVFHVVLLLSIRRRLRSLDTPPVRLSGA